MRGLRILAGVLAAAALALAGCASFQPGETTVILLPDEDGHVGAVSVASGGTSHVLDVGYAQVSVATAKSEPTPTRPIGRETIDQAYADLLRAQPLRPRSFTLNFVLDSTTLTEESKALLPVVLQAVHDRSPTEITVFGHADSTGTEQRNTKLSADRARAVAAALRKADPAMRDIDVQWFGDRVPLVKSQGNEPRNRRVEIQIL
jgi:outer membrane protein OmpA-like peptidoglycan-associated protein